MFPAGAVLLLVALTVPSRPASPAVGDLITLEFPAPVALEPSADYEIVSQDNGRVVVRTFRPAPFVLHGVTGDIRFQNLIVPVRSVLDPKQPMTPAPLVPPREVPMPREPLFVIAAAAFAAAIAWALVWYRARSARNETVPAVTPEERFRTAVIALRTRAEGPRWASLADETRRFLAATRPRLGAELTTRELVPRLNDSELVVEAILRQGDLEKFSTRGAEPLPFDEIAARALALAAPPAVEMIEGGAR